MELNDKAFKIHEDYNHKTGGNDLLLIRLPESFDDTPSLSLNSNANIPNAYASKKKRRVVVTRWGVTRLKCLSSFSEVFLKAKLRYVNNYEYAYAY